MILNSEKFIKLTKKTLLLTLIITIQYSCQKQNKKGQENVANYAVSGDTIIFPQNSNIKPGLKFHTIIEQQFQRELTTAGTVKVIPNNYAEVAPPFPGRVLKSYVKLGQKVVPGSPIFEMSSPDYYTSQKDYINAKQEFHQSERKLNRQKDLLKHGVGIQREIEEAESEFQTKKSELAHASAALKIFNINPSNIILGQPLVVTSPISGKILENNIVIGQYLKEDAEPIAIVAELSKIWVSGQVKEKDIHLINSISEVEIMTSALPSKRIKGKVHHVNEIVNSDTRSVEVLVECKNTEQDLRPGMYVNVLFKAVPENSILIPSKSVFQQENAQYVYVKIDENQYEKRQIESDNTSHGNVVVKSGLKAGEIIISDGGWLILKNQ